MDHRLLAIDVLAGFHGVDGNPLVPVVRCGDNDRIDIFTGQNFLVIARRKDVIAPEFLTVSEPSVVAVSHRDDLYARHLRRDLGVSLPLNPGSDECELNMIVSRHRAGISSLSRRERMYLRREKAGCGCVSGYL